MTLEMVERNTGTGKLFLVFRDGVLCAVAFDDPRTRTPKQWSRRFGRFEIVAGKGNPEVMGRIDAYFAGDTAAIDSIPVDPGGTGFQRRVWRQLRRIPAGRTASYGDIARAIGSPKAVRAVGRANGANPISIVIPCHRVVGADGRLVGYGGGLDRKRWLLRHETGAGRARPLQPPAIRQESLFA